MNKFNPLQYITDVDPTAEEVLDASSWFSTEYLDIVFRWDYNSNAAWGPDEGGHLAWFMAQGWYVYEKVANDIGPVGGVYEYTYKMKRRKMQAERVLQDMITEFTDAYNEGREMNDDRYDELVTLYSVMLDKTEDELIASITATDATESLVTGVLALFPTDFDEYETAVDAALDDLGSGREDLIDIQFDGVIAKARQDLVNRGLYNSTTWTSTLAGIERERALAKNKLADELAARTIAAEGDLHKAQNNVRVSVLAAYERLIDRTRANALTPTEVRNKVLGAMFNFMERRTDDYPGLGELSNIAAQLGFSEGAAVGSPTS